MKFPPTTSGSVIALVFLFVFAGSCPAKGAEPGWLGFTTDVKLGGISLFSLTIDSITIKSVAPNSPAAAAKIAVGDLIVEVEGIVVKGTNGLTIKSKLSAAAGAVVRLKLRRTSGEEYAASLTAVPKPRSPTPK